MKYKPGQYLKTTREVLEAILEGHKMIMGEDEEELGVIPFIVSQEYLELDEPFNDTYFRKVASRSRILNGMELDDPVWEEPNKNDLYYFPTLESPNYDFRNWKGDRVDMDRLKNGEVYLRIGSAAKHGEAAGKWRFK